MSEPVLVEHRGDVAVVTLNAPEKRNAISTQMRVDLRDKLVDLGLKRDCRAIVLTGAAGQFCTGGDVGEMVPGGADPVWAAHRLQILHDVVRAIVRGPKPVIAAVEGAAAGAGFSLAMACDQIVAANNARFVSAFVKLGLVADCGLQFSLTQRVGAAVAKRILLGAETIGAEQAAGMGMVDLVTAPGEALEAAVKAATRFTDFAPLAVAATKLAFSRGPASLEDALALESDLQSRLARTADHEEGKAAFLERRKPDFKGA
jgi:enoyl-CoA hydratase/carnithine racemase